jgi:hypothetical protein
MPTFNLLLSTYLTAAEPYGNLLKPISVSNLADAQWLVNWDGLFGHDALLYKKCDLRYELISTQSSGLTATANTGFLALTGISSAYQAGNIPSTLLGLLTIQAGPAASNYRFLQNSLADAHGVQINIPTGTSSIGVRFYNDDAITLQSGVVDYIIRLQLTLYNE